jgi:hypothetical protein
MAGRETKMAKKPAARAAGILNRSGR